MKSVSEELKVKLQVRASVKREYNIASAGEYQKRIQYSQSKVVTTKGSDFGS